MSLQNELNDQSSSYNYESDEFNDRHGGYHNNPAENYYYYNYQQTPRKAHSRQYNQYTPNQPQQGNNYNQYNQYWQQYPESYANEQR